MENEGWVYRKEDGPEDKKNKDILFFIIFIYYFYSWFMYINFIIYFIFYY